MPIFSTETIGGAGMTPPAIDWPESLEPLLDCLQTRACSQDVFLKKSIVRELSTRERYPKRGVFSRNRRESDAR